VLDILDKSTFDFIDKGRFFLRISDEIIRFIRSESDTIANVKKDITVNLEGYALKLLTLF
jgi:hypothetical protein